MSTPQSSPAEIRIQVRYFASLRDRLGLDDAPATVPGGATAEQVWVVVTADAERPANTLVAVNMEYVDWDHVVAEGDEVAFFPPVTGG